MYGQVGLAAQNNQNKSSFDNNAQLVIQPVRVRFTFLDIENIRQSYSELYDKYNGYDALSGILFDSFTAPTQPASEGNVDNLLENYNFAKPLFPNMRQVPLVNEIAYIITFPSVDTQDPDFVDLNRTEYYYFLPINLWNTTHQNGFPDPLVQWNEEESSEPKINSYTNAQAGATQNTTEPENEDINLGDTFEEKEGIKNLQPYEGDIIYEGRWGQSIRFGSTVLNKNPWSTQGTNGDPIFMLVNGQSQTQTQPWIPTNENINEDLNSIYATSTQQIPINVASTNYDSYPSDPPIAPNQYIENQIILNSGRLLFNSKSDHILLTSGKSVNINAYSSFNVDTENVFIQSNKIYLGSKDANEPLLLGNQTVDLLSELITTVKSFATICKTIVGVPAGVPMATLNAIASTTEASLKVIEKDLKNITSKDNFTI